MILPVINIGTGYQIGLVVIIDTGYKIGLMWSSPLTQGIKIGLLGYGGLLRLSQDRMPVVFYDRPAIQAEAMSFFFFFFFFFCLSAQHPQSDRVYPRSTILQQGMHLNVFSKVYCDRVYFSCAERKGQVLTPPPSGTPYPVEKSSAPPPPRGSIPLPRWGRFNEISCVKMAFSCDIKNHY